MRRSRRMNILKVAVLSLAAVTGLMGTRCAEPDGTSILNLVHGIPGPESTFDIIVTNNFLMQIPLEDVSFGTAVALPLNPGIVTVGIYPPDSIGGGPLPDAVLFRAFFVKANDVSTAAAYQRIDDSGSAVPTLAHFDSPEPPTDGSANVTAYHLAWAPTVGVYANGAVPITTGFDNSESASLNVPPATYGVDITAPDTPGTVLFPVGDVDVQANSSVNAYAIGTFPDDFTVVPIVNF